MYELADATTDQSLLPADLGLSPDQYDLLASLALQAQGFATLDGRRVYVWESFTRHVAR
jgi:hypothetical protein